MKDDAALEDYLLGKALAEATLTYADGSTFQGDALAGEAKLLREAWLNIRRLAAGVPLELVEQAAIAGALSADFEATAAARSVLAGRLAAISQPAERGWAV